MQEQVQHLVRLVDDLLDVSRIMRDKITLHEETLNLAGLVRGTVADFADQADAAGVTLTAEISPGPVWVKGDETRLAQVVGNLIHNASKFTDRGGRITVALRQDVSSHRAELQIRDTGIGIAPEMLPRLFEVFSQADCSLERSSGGLGVGLALVKGLVELHGGDVSANSAGLGQGAEFTVCLPLAHAPVESHVGAVDAQRPQRHCRVLIIDDQPDTLRTMRALLENLGHEVSTASNGEEGIRQARQTQPHVIFSDIGLPGMDGYALARVVRTDPALQTSYLVAITGYGQKSDQHRAQQAGFDQHLTKPIAFQEIQSVFASLR
jgi:CheY-like chemotaxis protein